MLREGYESQLRQLKEDRDRWYQFALRQQPRQITAQTYTEVHGDAEINFRIKIDNSIRVIKEIARQQQEESLKGNVKKKFFEYLEGIGKEGTKEAAKAAAKKLYEFTKDNLPSLLFKIAPYLNDIIKL